MSLPALTLKRENPFFFPASCGVTLDVDALCNFLLSRLLSLPLAPFWANALFVTVYAAGDIAWSKSSRDPGPFCGVLLRLEFWLLGLLMDLKILDRLFDLTSGCS